MPRVVDHESRRRELATALWRVVLDRGVEGTSVRAVAAESGWSAGALRHYFSSQDDLYAFALGLMAEQASSRVRTVLADDSLGPLERGVLLVEQFLPLDETRRSECLVWYAFADRVRLDTVLADVRAGGWHGTRHVARVVVADLAGAVRPAGLTSTLADADLEQRAGRLHVLVDGWAVHGISYPDHVPPEALRAQVRAELTSWA